MLAKFLFILETDLILSIVSSIMLLNCCWIPEGILSTCPTPFLIFDKALLSAIFFTIFLDFFNGAKISSKFLFSF